MKSSLRTINLCRLAYSTHSFETALHLCDSTDYLPTASFYGLFLPVLVSLTAKHLLQPYWERYALSLDVDGLQRRRANLQRAKAEAHRALELMQPMAERIATAERAINGLVITSARYGKLFTPPAPTAFHSATGDDEERRPFSYANHAEQTIDVTVQLQSLVSDSKLIITDAIKVTCMGMWYTLTVATARLLRPVRRRIEGAARAVHVPRPAALDRRRRRQVRLSAKGV